MVEEVKTEQPNIPETAEPAVTTPPAENPTVAQPPKAEEVPVVEPTKDGPGRPNEYTPQVVIKGMEYVATYEQQGDVVPTIEGLSLHLGVSRKTLYNWAEDPEKVEFLHIFEVCMAKQGRSLVNKGLTGEFNPTISKLLLSKHGYIEKSETDNTHHFDEPAERDKAKLDAILNGTSKTTTEQGSSEGGGTRDTSQPPVPVQ